MMDGKPHQLIDIVENRQLDPLRDYFSCATLEKSVNKCV